MSHNYGASCEVSNERVIEGLRNTLFKFAYYLLVCYSRKTN